MRIEPNCRNHREERKVDAQMNPGARRVLIVDDNPVDAELLHLALSAFGYSVEVAHDGDEAFATFVAANIVW